MNVHGINAAEINRIKSKIVYSISMENNLNERIFASLFLIVSASLRTLES